MVAKAGACHARRRLLPALTYVHCIARTELRRRATGGQANPAAGGRAWTRATGAGITWLDAQIATGNLPPRQTVQQHTHKLLISLVGLPRFELGTSCTPSKRDTRLRYSPNLRNNVLILAQRVARADQLPGTTSGRRQNVLLLPRRYQATINLLKTHDKLARGRDLMAARLGGLPSRYLSERFGCGGAPVVIGTGVENSDQGGGTHASVFRADSIRGRARAGRRR